LGAEAALNRALGRSVAAASNAPETVLSEQSLISIVDDDQSFRDSMRRLLKSLGYAVAVFPSAAEFLASPKLAATACLVADVHMPAITGIELLQTSDRNRARDPNDPRHRLSDDNVQERMLTLGVECYLRKPLEEAHLIGCLRAALAGGKAPREAS
jgi:FixJ family two-component response regulator